jgi:hypothetical protein
MARRIWMALYVSAIAAVVIATAWGVLHGIGDGLG